MLAIKTLLYFGLPLAAIVVHEAKAQRAAPTTDHQTATLNTCGVEQQEDAATRRRGDAEIAPDRAKPRISKAQAMEVLRKEHTTRALLNFAGYHRLPIEKFPDGGYPALMFEVGGATIHLYTQGMAAAQVTHDVPALETAQWPAMLTYPMCETLTISCDPPCAAIYWEASGGQFYGTFATESGQSIADGCGEYVDPPGHCFGVAAPLGEGVVRGELSGAQMYANFVVQVE